MISCSSDFHPTESSSGSPRSTQQDIVDQLQRIMVDCEEKANTIRGWWSCKTNAPVQRNNLMIYTLCDLLTKMNSTQYFKDYLQKINDISQQFHSQQQEHLNQLNDLKIGHRKTVDKLNNEIFQLQKRIHQLEGSAQGQIPNDQGNVTNVLGQSAQLRQQVATQEGVIQSLQRANDDIYRDSDSRLAEEIQRGIAVEKQYRKKVKKEQTYEPFLTFAIPDKGKEKEKDKKKNKISMKPRFFQQPHSQFIIIITRLIFFIIFFLFFFTIIID
ncbi:MAG: hypothetical protein EZS28_014797 [Streblomastix strix]|uniref:Uncharacterized protein n=1 Tax=Streblomastix strix TaxID=222440 RepID=A0A5J4W467_9EUKA|nr:MAG: hypothetical protein EZS28_014797 [Streblomastix strix]